MKSFRNRANGQGDVFLIFFFFFFFFFFFLTSGGHFVQPSGTILAILEMDLRGPLP